MLPNYLLGQPNTQWHLRRKLNNGWYQAQFGRHYWAAHMYVGAIRRALEIVAAEDKTFRLETRWLIGTTLDKKLIALTTPPLM